MGQKREGSDCPECGTTNAVGSKFCESCGLVLVQEKKSPNQTLPDRETKRDIERTLGRARAQLKGIRIAMGVLACLSALATAIILLAATVDRAFLMPALVAVVFTGAILAGTIFFYAQPLVWTLVSACLATVLAILAPGILEIFLAVGLWGALPLTLKITKLRREYPNLITSAKLKHRDRRDVGTSAARVRAEERRAQRRHAAVQPILIVGGIVLLVVVGVIATVQLTADPPPPRRTATAPPPAPSLSPEEEARIKALFGPALQQFHQAWSASDLDAIIAMGTQDFFDNRLASVKEILRRERWDTGFPEIEGPDLRGRGAKREAWFPIFPKGTLKTHWSFVDGEWRLARTVFSRIR